jgi:N-acetylneuraminate synthase
MKTQFIAEVSSNHQGDLDRCKRFIDCAREIGCDSVKFQLFKIEELFSSEARKAKPELNDRKAWELPVEYIPELSSYSHANGLKFSCTPFYLKAVEELEPYVDFFKIASYELLWDELLIRCSKTKRPVVLSTGMATLSEINHALDTLTTAGCRDITLLHCISGYPTPIEQCNLAAIATLRNATGCKIGWSDHSVSSQVVHRAIHQWGAVAIEFHLDLDGAGDEFKTGHCWLPDAMKKMIDSVSDTSLSHDWTDADGNGQKIPSQIERVERTWRADPSDGLRPLKETRLQISLVQS